MATILRVNGLANEETLRELRRELTASSFGEASAQDFIQSHPEILAPLELLEFVDQIRFHKRNQINPSDPRPGTRIPDFAGVKFFPDSVPVIVELKSPQARILDHSTRDLSDAARECANQLQTAVVHLLRPEVRDELASRYGWDIDGAIGTTILDAALKIDGSSPAQATSSDWIPIMQSLKDEGVGLIAIVGHTQEFGGQAEFLERARLEFESRGASLVTFDELLQINEVLVDYAGRNTGLMQYFRRERELHHDGSSLCNLASGRALPKEKVSEIQLILHRLGTESVCVYGLGPPPVPDKAGNRELVWRAHAFFNVEMLWSRPTHLKGDERLLWAGRLDGRWFVIKERLSEPFKGGVVWYEFSPPVEVPVA